MSRRSIQRLGTPVRRFLFFCLFFSLLNVSTAVAPRNVRAQGITDILPRTASPLDRGSATRRFAPGVMIPVPAQPEVEDTVLPRDFGPLLGAAATAWNPRVISTTETLAYLAAEEPTRRTIWALDFSFKPVRMINVGGRRVWYMVFRVRNRGGHLVPTRNKDGIYQAQPTDDLDRELYFRGTFELYSHEYKKCYGSEFSAAAVAAIRRRETPNRELLNLAELAVAPLPVVGRDDDGVWGVALWNVDTRVDDRIDFFSVYVGGLTNAYRLGEEGEPRPKLLQLNFWRPGDEISPNEDEIRYGTPDGEEARYGQETLDPRRWVYLPRCSVDG